MASPYFSPAPSPERHDLADEFVAGDDRRLAIAGAMLVAPEERRAEIALEVAGADADRADPDHDLARPGLRDRPFLEAIILGAMTDHGLHGPGIGPVVRFCRPSPGQ